MWGFYPVSHLLWNFYLKLYRYIHNCTSFIFNQTVLPFNAWRNYFNRSRSQAFWAEQRWGLIGNSLQPHCLYVSTSNNWIWSFQLSCGALALHFSSKLQVILGDADTIYTIFLQNSRINWWYRCSIEHIQIVNLICSKPYEIVTS